MLRLQRTGLVCRASGQKVNSRGKVSSRPGPPSPKERRKQMAEQQAQVATQQQQQPQQTPQVAQQPLPSSSSGAQPQPAQTQTQTAQQQPQGPTTTPQVVVDRIFARMVACAGIPVALGLVLLYIFYILKKQGGDDFPVWPAYVSQTLTFGGGLFGITYGALSASWDPSREGSLLGWTEFRANLPMFLSKGTDGKK